MSLSLLKRSLEVVDCELSQKNKKAQSKRKLTEERFDEFHETFQAPRHKKQEPYKKLTLDEIRNTQKSSKVEENLEKLLKLSKNSVKMDKVSTDKIIQRAKTGHYIIPQGEKKIEEESIFTEEDFKTFEEEYFA